MKSEDFAVLTMKQAELLNDSQRVLSIEDLPEVQKIKQDYEARLQEKDSCAKSQTQILESQIQSLKM